MEEWEWVCWHLTKSKTLPCLKGKERWRLKLPSKRWKYSNIFVCVLHLIFTHRNNYFSSSKLSTSGRSHVFYFHQRRAAKDMFVTYLMGSWRTWHFCHTCQPCLQRHWHRRVSLARAATGIVFVATTVLSRQTRVCHDKYLSPQTFRRDKHNFVATKDVFCRDKYVFVATEMILVAAPANGRKARGTEQEHSISKSQIKHDRAWSPNGWVTVTC